MTKALCISRLSIIASVLCLLSTLAALPSAAQAPAAETAASLFKTNCVMCHGVDGAGSELGKRFGAPDLRTKEIQQLAPAVLAHTITAGKNQMPAFGSRLDEQQVQKLVDYVRQLHDGSQPAAK